MKIDFEKSSGSYLYDKNTSSKYLDFFGMYSSLPIGYNHSVFEGEFEDKIKTISKIRMANNSFKSDELESFREEFRTHIFSD